MTQKHKFGIYYNNKKRESYDNPQIANAPESRLIRYFFPFSDQLVQWSSPQTNRLLLEAGFWRHQETWGNKRPPSDIADPLAVGITDNNPQNTTGYAQLIQNYHGRVGETDTASHNPNYRSMFNLSYVTGSHTFKTGFDLNGANRWSDRSSVVPYSLVVSTLANNGAGIGIPVPLSITLRSDGCTDPLVRQVNGGLVGGQTSVQPYCPTPILQKVPSEGGAFVQDRWTMDRLTISAGLRIDWFYSEIPTVHFGPSMITPNRNYDVPGIKTTEYKDWTPKVAAAYDLFGNGRTALKVNYGKYVLGQALGGLTTQGAYNVQLTSSRNWVDNDRDFVPDCDLTRNTAQGPTQAGIDNQVDTCLAAAGVNANFYDNALRPAAAVQDEARYGWGKRPYSWEMAVAAQHELNQGISVTAGVFWRWFGNFLVTDNISGTARDYTEYSITPSLIPTAPASAGGESLPSDLNTARFYNINPGVAVNNVTGLSKHMFPGSNVYDHWFGYDLTANFRLANGVTLQGGLATGHQTTDFCDVQDPAIAGDRALVEMLAVATCRRRSTRCHMEQNWLTADQVPGLLHHPQDRRAAGRLVPEHPGHRVRGVVRGAQHRPGAAGVAGRPGPSAGWRRGDRHHQPEHHPARWNLRSAVQPDRPATGQEPPVRGTPGRGQPGRLQRPQLGHDQPGQFHLFDVAGAAGRRSAATVQGNGDVRLLSTASPLAGIPRPRLIGDGAFSFW